MYNEVEQSLIKTVELLIKNGKFNKKIRMGKKLDYELFSIPYFYEILSCILKSVNIKFNTFLENAIKNIVELNTNNEMIYKYSSLKSNKFSIAIQSEKEIEDYLLECQLNLNGEQNLLVKYNELVDKIIKIENSQDATIVIKHDIDLLFKDKTTNCIYYTEIKYNDDHDTGKFMDINRKFLKTYAYLIRELKITNKEQLKPILMYFNKKRMKGNIYLPESENIYRGNKFFDTFTNVDYKYLDKCFKTISESKEVIAKFNKLYKYIMNI